MFTVAPWLVRILFGSGFESSINVRRLYTTVFPAIIAVNVAWGFNDCLGSGWKKNTPESHSSPVLVKISSCSWAWCTQISGYLGYAKRVTVVLEACVTTGLFLDPVSLQT